MRHGSGSGCVLLVTTIMNDQQYSAVQYFCLQNMNHIFPTFCIQPCLREILSGNGLVLQIRMAGAVVPQHICVGNRVCDAPSPRYPIEYMYMTLYQTRLCGQVLYNVHGVASTRTKVE